MVTGNNTYSSLYDNWIYMFNSYVGGETYKSANYLTRYVLESDNEYTARLASTPLDNHCASVISVYNSFLFRENPVRILNSIKNAPYVNDFLMNADHDGRSLTNFMKEVATWSSVFGHCWILLTKPNVGAVTQADEIASGVRPYVSLLTPLTVLDWNWTRQQNGAMVLDYFRYVEDTSGSIYTIKEWTLDTITSYVIDVEKDVLVDEIIEPNQLKQIPAVIAYNGRNITRGTGISDITDIAGVQRFIYNATSEIEQSIRMDSHPSLVKTEDTVASAGTGAIITVPENMDPSLKPYLLEFNGGSIDSMYNAIDHSVEAINKMASLGGVRATDVKVMSGVARETEFQLLNAKLAEKGDNLELAEEQLWTFWCDYQGYTWDGVITYPSSFNLRDTESEINQLKIAKDTATDESVLKMIDEKIVSWLGEDDEESQV